MQADILDRCPDNRQATGLRCEHVNLVGALPHIAEQAFDGIGGLNVAMHRLRELVKRQEMLFVLCQASYRFWIALSVLGFEGRQLGQRLLLIGLLPDAHEFSLDFPTLASGNGIEHIALFMHQTALTWRGRKQLRDRRQQPVVPIGHDQVDVSGPSCPQILQQAEPPLFAFLRARS